MEALLPIALVAGIGGIAYLYIKRDKGDSDVQAAMSQYSSRGTMLANAPPVRAKEQEEHDFHHEPATTQSEHHEKERTNDQKLADVFRGIDKKVNADFADYRRLEVSSDPADQKKAAALRAKYKDWTGSRVQHMGSM